MKILLPLFVFGFFFNTTARAIDPAVLAAKPAQIEVLRMTEVPLVLSEEVGGWIAIPEIFKTWSATIFKADAKHLGVARITVIESGYLLIACNYDYQGNKSGDWSDEAMSRGDFKKAGWMELKKSELGGELIQQDNRAQVIFYREVKKGETFSLRCNKYDPPYPILLHPKALAAR